MLTEEGAKAARTEGGFQVKKGRGWKWEGTREMKEERKGLRWFASLCGWEAVENGDLLRAQPEEWAGRKRSSWLERTRQAAGFAKCVGQECQGGCDPAAYTRWDKDH